MIEPQDPSYDGLRRLFATTAPGVRSVVRVAVERVGDTCGFGVPLYEYNGQRSQLARWAEHKGTEGLVQYQRDKNRVSLDGLPSLRWVGVDVEDDDRR